MSAVKFWKPEREQDGEAAVLAEYVSVLRGTPVLLLCPVCDGVGCEFCPARRS